MEISVEYNPGASSQGQPKVSEPLGFVGPAAVEQTAQTPAAGAGNVRITGEGVVPQHDENIIRQPEGAAAGSGASPSFEQIHARDVFSAVLFEFGLSPTKENLELADMLMKSEIPMTKENLLKLNQAIKLLGPERLAEGIFLIQNQMRINQNTGDLLGAYAQGKWNMAAGLGNLAVNIENLSDPVLRDTLFQVFSYTPPKENLLAGLFEQTAAAVVNPGETESIVSSIHQAFQNMDLNIQGFQRLAQELIKAHPEQQPLVQQLLSEKTDMIQWINENHGIINEGILRLIPNGGLNTESITKLIMSLPGADGLKETLLAPRNPENQGEPLILKNNILEFIIKSIGLTNNPENGNSPAGNLPREAALQLQAAFPEAFSRNDGANPQNQGFLKQLLYPLEKGSAVEMDIYFNRLRENLAHTQRLLAGNDSPEAARIRLIVESISNHLNFISQLREQIYIHVPFNIFNQEYNGEIHIFRNKKSKHGGKSAVSVLIALDTAGIGRFEAFVQKTGNSLNCQFRLELPETEGFVRAHIPRLETALRQKGYFLESFSFRNLEDAFHLTDSLDSLINPEVAEKTGRFFIDVRV